MRVTVVIPALNEAGNIGRLVTETYASVPASRLAEVIVVDDASTDATGAEIKALIEGGNCAGLRYLRHDRRSGQSAAMRSGILAATSPIIATMDGDGQNDPADIPRLLEALAGHDCVATRRRRREDDWIKRISSKVANGFRDAVTGVPGVTDAGCTYRAIRREALTELFVFNGMHRFLPTILHLQGFRITEIEVNHRPRTTGASKYGIGNRIWRGIADCFAMVWYRKRVVPGRRTRPEGA